MGRVKTSTKLALAVLLVVVAIQYDVAAAAAACYPQTLQVTTSTLPTHKNRVYDLRHKSGPVVYTSASPRSASPYRRAARLPETAPPSGLALFSFLLVGGVSLRADGVGLQLPKQRT